MYRTGSEDKGYGAYYVGHGVPDKSEFDWTDPENTLSVGDLYLDQNTDTSFEYTETGWVLLLENEE